MLVILSCLRRLINPSCLKGVDSQADNKKYMAGCFSFKSHACERGYSVGVVVAAQLMIPG